MRLRWSIVACVLGLLVLSANAQAAKEYELNDTRDTAYGPLEGGKAYTATFETANDVDWYLFYIKTYSQMDFSTTMIDSKCTSIFDEPEVEVRDKDGQQLKESPFLNLPIFAEDEGKTYHALLTMNPGRYYIVASNDPGCEGSIYRFQIDPATAITANRECGEAIVSKESVGPTLTKVAGELSKNSEKLAKPTEQVKADEASLAVLDKRWEKFLVKWKAAVHRLARHRGIPGYVRRRKTRSLLATKRRTNRGLQGQKAALKKKLASAQAVQAKILEQRAGLEALEAQSKSTLSQAEAQIAAHC